LNTLPFVHWRVSQCILFVVATGITASVSAQVEDNLKLRANLTGSTDDNFFRTSNAAVSERITSQSIGVNMMLPVSLQTFLLDASLTSNQHQINSNFNFVGQNYNAAWQWGLTPRLRGSLTSDRVESLNANSDSLTPTLRNKNVTQNTALSSVYEMGGPWQLTVGVSDTSTTNERALISQTDNRSSGLNAGLRYVLASGNSLAYSLRNASGTSGNDYRSTAHDFSANWIPSGNTSFNARIAYLDQRFSLVPQFDFSGVSGAVSLSWRASGKVTVNSGWQRDLSAYQTAGTTHTQTDAFNVGANWSIKARTSVGLQYRSSVRNDQGNPSGVAATRQDRLQDLSLRFNWQPSPSVALGATLTQYMRNTNQANADFDANQLSLSAQVSF
jgi:exopolysaccharide biosynthesis operon protein EpsL